MAKAKRTKSGGQLHDQLWNIREGLLNQMDDYLRSGGSTTDKRYAELKGRYNKVGEKYEEYTDRILNTKSQQKLNRERNVTMNMSQALSRNGLPKYAEAERQKTNELTRKMRNMQYSTRTYMGANKG